MSDAIDRVDHMFTLECDAEVDELESATLQQYYREAMIQGYNFGFEVGTKGEGTPHSPESALRVTRGFKDSLRQVLPSL